MWGECFDSTLAWAPKYKKKIKKYKICSPLMIYHLTRKKKFTFHLPPAFFLLQQHLKTASSM